MSAEVTNALEAYRFNDGANLCYQFVWHEFCDWYLEMIKLGLYGDDEQLRESSRNILQKALIAVLKLLHPFMPFVTEEIWQRLPESSGSIMVSGFPVASDFLEDEKAVQEMDLLMGTITGIRNIRGEMNIPPSRKVNVVVDVADQKDGDVLRQNMAHIQNLGKVNNVKIGSGIPKPEASATALFGHNQVHVLLKGLLDFEEEKKRLRKEIIKVRKDIDFARKKLSNEGFMKKAPAEVVEEVRTKVQGLSAKLEKLEQNLQFFEKVK